VRRIEPSYGELAYIDAVDQCA